MFHRISVCTSCGSISKTMSKVKPIVLWELVSSYKTSRSASTTLDNSKKPRSLDEDSLNVEIYALLLSRSIYDLPLLECSSVASRILSTSFMGSKLFACSNTQIAWGATSIHPIDVFINRVIKFLITLLQKHKHIFGISP